MLIYEQRLWSTTYPFNVDSGAEYIGTKGRMFLSKRGKFEVRGERNLPLEVTLASVPKADVKQNFQNWIDCIKSGSSPNANIEIGHRTATAAHLANIAVRLGRTIHFDPTQDDIVRDDDANAMLTRKYRKGGHWGIPNGVESKSEPVGLIGTGLFGSALAERLLAVGLRRKNSQPDAREGRSSRGTWGNLV